MNSNLNIATAARQYASRPKDERFESLDAMIANAMTQRDHSTERTYNLKDLQFIATGADSRSLPDSGAPLDGSAPGSLKIASPRGAANMTHWAFGQACRTLGAPANYLRSLPPAIAADALNFGIRDSATGTAVSLLVQAPNGTPEPTIRACTSDRYKRVWDAELYGAIAQTMTRTDDRWQLPPTWTGEGAGAYRGDRDSFLILVNGGSIVTDPSMRNTRGGFGNATGGAGVDPGSMFRGLLVRNSEVGASSITIEQILFEYVCGNHMLWGAVVDKTFRRRHIGDSVKRDSIREIADVAYRWTQRSASQDEALIKALIDHEIAHTPEGVADELKAMGATAPQAQAAVDHCAQYFTASPRSFWGVAQGMTHASQETGYQDDRLALDQLAAKVLARGRKLVAA
jgi:hypothetical protein